VKSEAAGAEVGEARTRERQGQRSGSIEQREDREKTERRHQCSQKNKGREMTHCSSDSKSGGCRPSFVRPVVFFIARLHHASYFLSSHLVILGGCNDRGGSD
jgi:hypothetical protein